MICCLNPACHNPPNPDGTMFCSNCGVGLVVLRNRYRPIKSLGGGGFGKTYLAEDIDKLNEHCVIKQFAPQVQGTDALNKATELFEQEAKRLQQLGKHLKIPTLLAYFEQDNRLYLVQEFINGQNLLTELQQQGIFNEQKIRELLLDLLDILKTVHQYKVIHRDIKPENIIRHSDGKLVLIDFGASKQLTATVMTQVGTTIGSFGYAPLEQMEGGEAYPASDLYSIGATCFHLLSGIHPWELWKRQGYGWVASWRQHLQQSVSQNLGRMLDKLLQEEFQQRYQSAEEVLQDLNLSLSASIPPTQPVIATTVSPPPSTVISQPPPSTLLTPAKSLLISQGLPQKPSRQNTNFRKRFLVGAAITIVGTQFYGCVRYRLFPTSPIFLVESFPSSSFLERTLTGHSNPVGSVAISPDGKTLASGSNDNTIKLWNLATGEQIRTLTGHSDWVISVAFSPDGNTLASGSRGDTTIILWNLATGEQIGTLTGHSNLVISVAISPDGKTLASGSYDNTIKLWNLATGEQIRTLKGHFGAVYSVVFSPDGKTLASGSFDNTIKLWDIATGEQIRTFPSERYANTGHSDWVLSVAFSPDGKTLVSGSKDTTIKLWNLATGKEIRTLTGHSYEVNSVAISPDGKTLASGNGDSTIKLWNLATGQQIRTLTGTLTGHSNSVNSVAISPDGKTLASGSSDNTIKLWRLE
ncbi:serine/threonine-protein kinase [Nostoc sp. ChiSLP03a]|uniref:serine/threonine-protein kinase n=1 Tax=Nostoc sp. ChiSLP03a TaxID=3075380 RepID=UPI002AD54964|nr:serine/threonine-protein kinase [Nostoc sp. ChiSLP03a]MDZ8210667.1 serine/threonine-protein kinase [Nostoc sp. ChiSLP03a]